MCALCACVCAWVLALVCMCVLLTLGLAVLDAALEVLAVLDLLKPVVLQEGVTWMLELGDGHR